jgi:hypothetical protein
LQFYYYEAEGRPVYTCLSADIIHHEFGHAILDGIRPHFIESSSVQTAAFHEFLGDMTAILIILRNNKFRRNLAEQTGGDISEADQLAFIAEEFGRTVQDRPYLRSANNELTMDDIKDAHSPHEVSQVLTGAMFEILRRFSEHYLEERGRRPKEAFYDAIARMQRTALQPLDLLPPVEVTFKDYALAVLRTEELSNPKDPHGYYGMMVDVFKKRKIISQQEADELMKNRYLYHRLQVSVFHDIGHISRSRAAAYRFLDDNRVDLFIPNNQDIIVADLYDANKNTRLRRRLPRQIILEYVWREDVSLDGPQFGSFNGQTTTMLCGGTLVFDERGNVLSWSRKPGTQLDEGKKKKKAEIERAEENERGKLRREALLQEIARQVGLGRIGLTQPSDKGVLGTRMHPISAQKVNGTIKMEISPHLSLSEDEREQLAGGRQWQKSF